MSSVKKWNVQKGITVYESQDGEFVLASDYSALEAENAKLREECEYLAEENVEFKLLIKNLRKQLDERDVDITEQCRLNGMGAERELKLMTQRDKLAGLLREVLATHDYHADDGAEAADKARAALVQLK